MKLVFDSVDDRFGPEFFIELKNAEGTVIDGINNISPGNGLDQLAVILLASHELLERNREKHNVFPIEFGVGGAGKYVSQIQKKALQLFFDLYSAQYDSTTKPAQPPSSP